MKQLIFIVLLIPIILKAQETTPDNLSKSLKKYGVFALYHDWKYKAGDNPEWANPDFDDSSWQSFNNTNLYDEEIQKKAKKTNIVWYRKRIIINSTTTQKLVLNVYQSGASEIYLDGVLIHSLGKVCTNPDSVVRHNPINLPLSFPMEINKEQVLAVRFADSKKKFSLFPEVSGLNILVQEDVSANHYLFIANDSLINESGIIELGFRNGWRFRPGDNMDWAKPDFNDSDWMLYLPSMIVEPIPDSLWNGYGWFRYRFAVDSSVYSKVTNLYFSTYGAAEVYLDGKLVQKYGVFSTDPQEEKYYNRYYNYFYRIHPAVVLQPADSHLLAIRFSYHKGAQYKKLLGKYALTFGFNTGIGTDNVNQLKISTVKKDWQFIYISGTMLLLIVLLHGFLYLLFPTDRSNLYIAIVSFLLFLHIVATYLYLFFAPDVLQLRLFSDIPYIVLFAVAISMFPLTLSTMFNQKPCLMHKLLIWLSLIFALVNFILSGPNPNPFVVIVFPSLIIIYSTRVLLQAWRNKQKGMWFVAGGFLGLIVSTIASVFYAKYSQDFKNEIGLILGYVIYGSVPLGLTAFMASRFRDLYRNLEQKVKERTRELNQSLEELRSTQTQLIHSEKMASLGALTAGIAHEIQNPLNFVNNFSEVNTELIDELDEEAIKGNLEEVRAIAKDIKENEQKINHHGKRADSIVKGMLQHSRGSSGHKEPVDINALCDEYLRLSYHGFRAKDKSFNAEFKTNFDPNLPKINVNPQDIGRVLLNLINNAFYAVHTVKTRHALSLPQTPPPDNPTVLVSTKSMTTHVEIRVKDNGPGIPPEIIDKIFQPFFTTKPPGQGTGLGLSLAYDIVKAHGGEIKVETKPSRADADGKNEANPGTEFIIYLPLN